MKITTDYPLIIITVLAQGETLPSHCSYTAKSFAFPGKGNVLEKALEVSLASDANVVCDFWTLQPCRSA